MAARSCWPRPVPVAYTCRDSDRVSGRKRAGGLAADLHEAQPRQPDEPLVAFMDMPYRARASGKKYLVRDDVRPAFAFNDRGNANGAGESLGGACRKLGRRRELRGDEYRVGHTIAYGCVALGAATAWRMALAVIVARWS